MSTLLTYANKTVNVPVLMFCNSYTTVCPPVREDNPRALASFNYFISPSSVHQYTFAQYEMFRAEVCHLQGLYGWYNATYQIALLTFLILSMCVNNILSCKFLVKCKLILYTNICDQYKLSRGQRKVGSGQ